MSQDIHEIAPVLLRYQFPFNPLCIMWLVYYFDAEARRAQRGIKTVLKVRKSYSPVHENEISEKIIGAAIEVHRILGPGFWALFMKMRFAMSYI